MKKFFYPLMALALVVAGCAKEYDDSALKGQIEDLDGRLTKVEADLKKAETNINSTASLVATLSSADYVTGIEDVKDAQGQLIGFKLNFKTAPSTTFYVNEVGTVGAKQEGDKWYWAQGGEFVLVNGEKVPIEKTPVVEARDGKLQVSYDGGTTWTVLQDIVEVTYDDEKVNIKVGGETVSLDRVLSFSLKVDETKVGLDPDVAKKSMTIPYVLKGAAETDEVVIMATYAPAGWTVTATDGVLTIASASGLGKGTVVVTAINNTTGATSSQALIFDEASVLKATATAFTIGTEGGTVSVPIRTNISYTHKVEGEWLTYVETRAAHDEVMDFKADANTGAARVATITLTGEDGSVLVIVVGQKAKLLAAGISPLFGFQPYQENPHGMTLDANRSIAIVGDYLILSNANDWSKMPVYDRWTGAYLGDNIVNTAGLDSARKIYAITNDDAGHLIAVTYCDTRATDTDTNNDTLRGWVWKDGIDKAPASTWWAGYYNYGAGASWGFSNVKCAGDITADAVVATSASSGQALFDIFTDGKLTGTRLKKALYGASAWWSSNVVPIDGTAKTIEDMKFISCSGQFRSYLSYNSEDPFTYPAGWHMGTGTYGRNSIGGDYIKVGDHHLYGVLNGFGAGGSFSNGSNKFYYQLVVGEVGEVPTKDSFKDGAIFATRMTANEEGKIEGMGYGVQGMISPISYAGANGTMLGETLEVGDVAFATAEDGTVQVYALVMNIGLIAYNIAF